MFSRVNTAALIGIQGVGVNVEVDISSQGLPGFSIVGLGDSSVRESRDRLRSALKNMAQSQLFQRPITINLSPSNFAKSGTHYDLAMAVGLVCASDDELATSPLLLSSFILGELALDGTLTPVSGILPLAIYAKNEGFKQILLPQGNVDEASLAGIDCYGFKTLHDVIMFFREGSGNTKGANNTSSASIDCTFIPGRTHDSTLSVASEDTNSTQGNTGRLENDFIDVKGQDMGKRGALIAAAGMHNILLIGPPGSGKTMIANRIPHIMPNMTMAEALETTSIYSLAGWERMASSGTVRNGDGIITRRPFIAPHHTSSSVAIVGGGSNAMPGSVSFAHNGVLFLDEFLEFGRTVIEVLRQPMESRKILISRSKRVVEYPASFMLVAASNPCPCGHYQDAQKECLCPPSAVLRYRSKLSGPILDRIDLHVKVHSVSVTELMGEHGNRDNNDKKKVQDNGDKSLTSISMRQQVNSAYNMQRKRFAKTNITHNAQMSPAMTKEICILSEEVHNILHKAVDKYGLTARGYDKILRISRTIADLDQCENIQSMHLLEALQYRLTD